MTVYGGEETDWGTRSNGFFVGCTKCGWHSKVQMKIDTTDYEDSAEYFVYLKCLHCNNEARIYNGNR